MLEHLYGGARTQGVTLIAAYEEYRAGRFGFVVRMTRDREVAEELGRISSSASSGERADRMPDEMRQRLVDRAVS